MRALFDVPGTKPGVVLARQFVGPVLTAWGLAELTGDCQLVVSELLSNAIDHAPGTETYELELLGRPDGVRVSVADGSSIRPLIAEIDHTRARGRGMRIIEGISDGWGTDDHDGGKRVWVELTISSPSP